MPAWRPDPAGTAARLISLIEEVADRTEHLQPLGQPPAEGAIDKGVGSRRHFTRSRGVVCAHRLHPKVGDQPRASVVAQRDGHGGRRNDEIDGTKILLPPFSRTMAVQGDFDLAANPNPPAPQKFGHHDHHHPRMLFDTAEEWVVYNCSISLWSHTNKEKFKDRSARAAARRPGCSERSPRQFHASAGVAF